MLGRGVGEQRAVFDRAAAEFERNESPRPRTLSLLISRMPRGRRLQLAAGRIGRAGQALDFEAAAVGDRPALGFFDEHNDVFVRVGSGGILRLDRDAIENSEIVKSALRIDDVAFAQRSVWLDENLAANRANATCVLIAGDKTRFDARLRAFVDVVDDLHFRRQVRRPSRMFCRWLILRRSSLSSLQFRRISVTGVAAGVSRSDRRGRRRKSRLGKSFVVIKREDVVAVGRNVVIPNRAGPASKRRNGSNSSSLNACLPSMLSDATRDLLPFLNHVANEKLAFDAFVIVERLRIDLGLSRNPLD